MVGDAPASPAVLAAVAKAFAAGRRPVRAKSEKNKNDIVILFISSSTVTELEF